MASRTSGRKRLDELGTGVLLVRKPASRVPSEGKRQHARPPRTGHNDPGAHTITSRKPDVIFEFAVGPRLPQGATVPGRTTTLRFACGRTARPGAAPGRYKRPPGFRGPAICMIALTTSGTRAAGAAPKAARSRSSVAVGEVRLGQYCIGDREVEEAPPIATWARAGSVGRTCDESLAAAIDRSCRPAFAYEKARL